MLTETFLRQLKPTNKPKKIYDGKGTGLHVIVHPTGRKSFTLKYYHPETKKEQTLTIGTYPMIGLKEARLRVLELRANIATGQNPRPTRGDRESGHVSGKETFRALATEWMDTKGAHWSPSYRHKVEAMLRRHLYPNIGERAITTLSAREFLTLLRSIEHNIQGCIAHTLLQYISGVFRYAIATDRAINDPSQALRGALKPHRTENLAAITNPDHFGELLWLIDSYQGDFITKMCLKFTALTFQRSKSIRFAKWCDIDWGMRLWRIPAAEMKMKEAHLVPLSRQCLELLETLKPHSGRTGFLFPSAITSLKPISENTMLYALKRLGYSGRMTVHGFRTSASTLLNENGRHADVIEAALAHFSGSIRSIYNRARYLPERIEMYQWWADYCDTLRALVERSRAPRMLTEPYPIDRHIALSSTTISSSISAASANRRDISIAC